MKNPINEAISKAGSQTRLAGLLKIHKSNISHWKRLGTVPAIHALRIEELFGISARSLADRRNAV